MLPSPRTLARSSGPPRLPAPSPLRTPPPRCFSSMRTSREAHQGQSLPSPAIFSGQAPRECPSEGVYRVGRNARPGLPLRRTSIFCVLGAHLKSPVYADDKPRRGGGRPALSPFTSAIGKDQPPLTSRYERATMTCALGPLQAVYNPLPDEAMNLIPADIQGRRDAIAFLPRRIRSSKSQSGGWN